MNGKFIRNIEIVVELLDSDRRKKKVKRWLVLICVTREELETIFIPTSGQRKKYTSLR